MVADAQEITEVRPARLWFGLTGSAAAWLVLGFIDLLIVWLECAYEEQYMEVEAHPGARMACFILAVISLAVAGTAGVTSFRNWLRLSPNHRLLDARADGRPEFMAFVGIVISITLGMGIVWLSLPPLIIGFCARAK
jgi:hypothetical protein